MKKKRVVKRFTHEEDECIKQNIRQYGLYKGITNASLQLNRTERSIKDRYMFFIASPRSLNLQEVQTLIQLHESGIKFKNLKFIFHMNPLNLRIEYNKAKRIISNIDQKTVRTKLINGLDHSNLSNNMTIEQSDPSKITKDIFGFDDLDFQNFCNFSEEN